MKLRSTTQSPLYRDHARHQAQRSSAGGCFVAILFIGVFVMFIMLAMTGSCGNGSSGGRSFGGSGGFGGK